MTGSALPTLSSRPAPPRPGQPASLDALAAIPKRGVWLADTVTHPRQNLSPLGLRPRARLKALATSPALDGPLQAVADAIAAWPKVEVTTYWHFGDHDHVDEINFYVSPDELGHIRLDGSIDLVTTPELGAELMAEGLGRPVPRRGDG